MTHMLSRGSAVYFIQISFLSRMFFMVHATETEVNGVVWYTIVLTRTRGSGTCTTAAVLQTCSLLKAVEGCTESSLPSKYCCRRTTACDGVPVSTSHWTGRIGYGGDGDVAIGHVDLFKHQLNLVESARHGTKTSCVCACVSLAMAQRKKLNRARAVRAAK